MGFTILLWLVVLFYGLYYVIQIYQNPCTSEIFWTYQRGNHKWQFEEEQTTQWPKEKKNKQTLHRELKIDPDETH
jgi:hypothetical protein